MSDRGRSYATQHSPFKGSVFFVHYFLGDLENADNGHELWLSLKGLSERLRMHENTVYKAVNELVDGGWLSSLDVGDRKPYTPRRYRFEFPKVPLVYHPDHGLTSSERVDVSYPQSTQRLDAVHTESGRTSSERVDSVHSESGLTKRTKPLTKKNRAAGSKSGWKSNAAGVSAEDVIRRLEDQGVVLDLADDPVMAEASVRPASFADLKQSLPQRKDLDG